MTFDRAHFDTLNYAQRGLVFAVLPFPLFLTFAIAGDLPRGALVWAFCTAFLHALYACGDKRIHRKIGASVVILAVLHIMIVVQNPLRHFPY